MKKQNIILAVFFAIILAGCTTMPPLDMTLQNIPSVDRQDVELKSITVGYVAQTNKTTIETNHLVPPAWEMALQDAINRSLIFKDDQERKITISVRINHFDVPAAGFAMVSDCGAIYEITDRSSGETIFSEGVRTSGTVPMDYAFAGIIRVQESINRCARANISSFLSALDGSDI